MTRKIYDLRQQRAALLDAAEAALGQADRQTYEAKMEAAKALAGEINALEALEAARGEFSTSAEPPRVEQVAETGAADNSLNDILASNEYATAFAYAIRRRLNPETGTHNEALAPLYAALTQGGGATPGEDGGFLVPIDMSTRINELQRQLLHLITYFNVETVTTMSGWRVLDVKPTVGFTPVDEMEEIPQDDQPAFRRMSYAVKKYGLIVPVSRELASDETAGLFEYLARWFARKGVLTDNSLLLATLDSLTATALTAGKEVSGLKTALNKKLDPDISRNAILLTNQSGYDVLDNLEDSNNRPLLQPDPTTPTAKLFKGRPVIIMSDATLPNSGGTAPIYVGDFRQYATLFQRLPLELRSTDIGGKAWQTDSIEVRGIKRLDVKTWDTEAAVKLTIAIPQ